MNGFDLSTISNCYLGGTQMSAIYYGSQLIWPATGPTPPHDYSQDYLTIEFLDDPSVNVTLGLWATTQDNSSNYIDIDIYYSKNSGTWTKFNYMGNADDFNGGDVLRIRSNIMNYSSYLSNFWHIQCSSYGARFNIYGNIMSLLYGNNFVGQTVLPTVSTAHDGIFSGLFATQNVVNAKDLILPATTLTTSCYYRMFRNCTSLITAPELPATTLATICYEYMFGGCTSLVTAPELPATTLATDCYNYMFDGCTSLNYIKALFTTTPSIIYTDNWVRNVSSTGTFVKNSAATWNVTGENGIPSGWTVVNAS